MIKNEKQVEKTPRIKAKAFQNWGLIGIPDGDLASRSTHPQKTVHSHAKKKKKKDPKGSYIAQYIKLLPGAELLQSCTNVNS